jgi:hypothetical protein
VWKTHVIPALERFGRIVKISDSLRRKAILAEAAKKVSDRPSLLPCCGNLDVIADSVAHSSINWDAGRADPDDSVVQ